jgi:large subunit ribosomal protein L29
MKPADVRAMTDEQIVAAIGGLREEWRHLRFEDAVGRMTHTSRIGQIRRDIARMKTIQTEREISDRIAALTAASSD